MKHSRSPIYRRTPDECLYEAALRINSIMPPVNRPRNTNFITATQAYESQQETRALQNSVAQYYAAQEDHESESDSSSSEDEDEGPYWKYALQAKRQLRFPETQYEYYNSDAESEDDNPVAAYPATRTSGKRTTEARERVSKVPAKPQKPVFDGVYPPPRKPRNMPTRAQEPAPAPAPAPAPPQVPQNLPPVRENITPQISKPQPLSRSANKQPQPQPIDARKLRPNQDIPMDVDTEPVPLKTARMLPKDPPPHISAGKENTGRGPARQSEISRQVDTREIVKEILDTEITIPIRKIIGSSREIATDLTDVIKLKNTKPTAALISNDQAAQPFVANTGIRIVPSNFQGSLIKIVLYHADQPVTAIIDTGSELNIIRSGVAKSLKLPVDITQEITMNDANGGEGQLIGLAEGVELHCGNVKTTADIWIGNNTLPFDLLLGRTWQQDNLVSTEERLEGTYVVFRDPNTGKARYEIFIGEGTHAQEAQTKFFRIKRPRNTQSYALISSEPPEINSLSPNQDLELLTEFNNKDQSSLTPGIMPENVTQLSESLEVTSSMPSLSEKEIFRCTSCAPQDELAIVHTKVICPLLENNEDDKENIPPNPVNNEDTQPNQEDNVELILDTKDASSSMSGMCSEMVKHQDEQVRIIQQELNETLKARYKESPEQRQPLSTVHFELLSSENMEHFTSRPPTPIFGARNTPYMAAMSVSTAQGYISHIKPCPTDPSTNLAQVVLPGASLTYFRNGHFITSYGYGHACFHFSPSDLRVYEMTARMMSGDDSDSEMSETDSSENSPPDGAPPQARASDGAPLRLSPLSPQSPQPRRPLPPIRFTNNDHYVPPAEHVSHAPDPIPVFPLDRNAWYFVPPGPGNVVATAENLASSTPPIPVLSVRKWVAGQQVVYDHGMKNVPSLYWRNDGDFTEEERNVLLAAMYVICNLGHPTTVIPDSLKIDGYVEGHLVPRNDSDIRLVCIRLPRMDHLFARASKIWPNSIFGQFPQDLIHRPYAPPEPSNPPPEPPAAPRLRTIELPSVPEEPESIPSTNGIHDASTTESTDYDTDTEATYDDDTSTEATRDYDEYDELESETEATEHDPDAPWEPEAPAQDWHSSIPEAFEWSSPKPDPKDWEGPIDEEGWNKASEYRLDDTEPATRSSPELFEKYTNIQESYERWNALETRTTSTPTDISSSDDEDFTRDSILRPLPDLELPVQNLTIDDPMNEARPPASTTTPVAFTKPQTPPPSDNTLSANFERLRNILGILKQRIDAAMPPLAPEDDDSESPEDSSSDSMPGLESTSESDPNDYEPSSPEDSPRVLGILKIRPDVHRTQPYAFYASHPISIINHFIPGFDPPPPSDHHDESRWTYTTADAYRPLTTLRYPVQGRVHARFARSLAIMNRLITHLSKTTFGNRLSPRHTSSLRYIISPTEFKEFFSEYETFEGLERAISDKSKGNDAYNRWQGHLAQLISLRRVTNLTFRYSEDLIKTYGYEDGLRSYVHYHGIHICQTPLLPHPIFHAFEVQYLISLQRFLYDYNSPAEYHRINHLLSKTFHEARDLQKLTQDIVKRLAPPTASIGLEETQQGAGWQTV